MIGLGHTHFETPDDFGVFEAPIISKVIGGQKLQVAASVTLAQDGDEWAFLPERCRRSINIQSESSCRWP